MLFKPQNRQSGIGLLELMLALAIIAILIVMATRYFGISSQSQKINLAASEIVEIQQGLFQLRKNSTIKVPFKSMTQLKGYVTDSLSSDPSNGPFQGSTWAVTGNNDVSDPITITLTGTGINANVCNNLKNKLPEGVTTTTTCTDTSGLALSF